MTFSRIRKIVVSTASILTISACGMASAPMTKVSQDSIDSTEQKVLISQNDETILKDHGLEGPTDVQVDENGGVMFVDHDDDWVFVPGTDSENDGSVSPLWSAGICTGNFYTPRKISNSLEWGAQNSCVSTSPNDVYPHYIDVELRDTCANAACLRYDRLWKVRSSNSRYSNVAPVSESDYCEENDDRKYHVVVWVYVRGTQFGPYQSNTVRVDNCHVHPESGGVQ